MEKLENIEIQVTQIDYKKTLHSIIYNAIIDSVMSIFGFALLIIYSAKYSLEWGISALWFAPLILIGFGIIRWIHLK